MKIKVGRGAVRPVTCLSLARRIAILFFLAVAGLSAAVPGEAQAQTYRFNSVTVEGNQRVDAATILSYAGIARGQAVSAGQLNDAYQRILASGLFETVAIEPRGGRLVITVAEYPTINRINFEGNRRIKDEDLAPLIRSQSRRVFNPTVAQQDADLLTEAYAQEGRLAARVTPKVIRLSQNRVDLVFEILEGDVTEIERIGIVGNSAFSDSRLRRVLGTKQAGILRALIKKDTFIEDRIEFDKQVLRDFYQSRGYVDFRVTGVNAELTRERDGYFITFNVQEGQQFSFGAVTATSDLPEVDVDAFQAALKSRPGLVYSPSMVETDIARLERLAIQKGLDFVRVEPRVTRNDRDLTLDVEYVLSRGQRVFVERIDIEGNTATLDRVIRRQFEVAEGDPFNPRQIREAAERIRALGFFGRADVEAREGSSSDQVVIDVNVDEQPTGSLTFGATYSTSNGVGAVIKFQEANFLGRGQSLNLAVTTGVDNRQYLLGFVEPAFLGRPNLAFGLDLSYLETDNQNAQHDTAIGRFRPSFTFPTSEFGKLSLRLTSEVSELQSVSATAGAIVTAEAARGQLWNHSLGYTYSYDTRRGGLNPNAGVLLEFGQDFGGLAGNDRYLKTSARAIAQTKIINEQVTLRATVEGGMLNYSSGGSRVTDRFYMGPSVMRGFKPGGIGPRERDGAGVDEALGGEMFAVARFEAELPLGLPEEYGIHGGVFYDVGSLWGLSQTNANVLYSDRSWRHVVGVSVFWDTPIGPLRFNFSEALRKETYDRAQSFDLTISTQF